MTARAERGTRTGSGSGRSATAEGPSGGAAKAETSGRADRSTSHHASAPDAGQTKAHNTDQQVLLLGALSGALHGSRKHPAHCCPAL